MQKSIREKDQEIIEQLNAFDDWNDKYYYLLDLGKQLKQFDEKYKTEKYEIKDCQSQTWLYAQYQNGKVFYYGYSDALIIKGFLYVLTYIFSDATPEEIISSEIEFFKKTGLQEHLSPIRSNGVAAIIRQLKLYAMILSIKNKPSENE